MHIPILYEDTNIIAINKPAGVVVHGDGKSDIYTLSDWMYEQYSDAEHVGEPMVLQDGTEIKRPGIVHRLDKETSGVMLLAKTQQGFETLKEQFKNRRVEKTYHAFVYGNMKEDELTIDAPIGRSANNIRKWTSGKDMRNSDSARDALTEVKVLERGKDPERGEVVTLVEAKPQTGRTHQIRVHLNHVGRPILCDKLYTRRDCLLGFNRVALHARSISFSNCEGEQVTIAADYPEDFSNAQKNLEK